MRTRDAQAGLHVVIYEKIHTDPGRSRQTVDVITRIIGEAPAYPQLIDHLALATVRTLTESGVLVRAIPLEATVAAQYTANTPDEPSTQRYRSKPVLQAQYAEHLFTDLYDETTRKLIEVRSSGDRMTVCVIPRRYASR